MSEYSAKTLRDKAKARAKNLAKPGDYTKDQMTSSADWSPAAPINADVKTGARPISPRAYKRGGAVKKATGGEIADSIVNRNVKKANAERPGAGKHVGAFMCGGRMKRADGGSDSKRYVNIGGKKVEDTPEAKLAFAKKTFPNITEVGPNAEPIFPSNKKRGGAVKRACGGSVPSKAETKTDKKRIGTEEIMPKRAAAQHYAKGGKAKWIQSAISKPGALHKQLGVPEGEKIPAKKLAKAAEKGGKLGKRARLAQTLKGFKRADGGPLPSPEEAIGSEVRMKGLKVMPSRDNSAATMVTPSQLRREEGYTRADMMAKRPGRAMGGSANANPLSSAAKAVSGKAMGGRKGKGGKTSIAITINAGQKPQPIDLSAGQPGVGPGAPPPPMPAPSAPGIGAPPPAMMPPPPMGAGPMARKAGGRISKVAKSYKDMTAGSGSGEGRLQKTDVAKKRGDAPARKSGGAVRGK